MTWKEAINTPLFRVVDSLGNALWHAIISVAFTLASQHPRIEGTPLEGAALAGFYWCALIAVFYAVLFVGMFLACLVLTVENPRFAVTPETP